jgi:head-tail adaptor
MGEVQKSRVTLLDIAADAEVSRSTASLVIRNVPSVAETTRKRVLRSNFSVSGKVVGGNEANISLKNFLPTPEIDL